MISLLLALLISPPTKTASYEFTYSESETWITASIVLDEHGWPELQKHSVHPLRPNVVENSRPAVPGAGTELRGLSTSQLWTVTQEWNWNWELRFAEWVKTELDSTWWTRHAIATDCADAVLSARWIFARIHGLPAANHLITGHWFTYRSVKPEWEALPTATEWYDDQKFLAALDYLLSQAFTQSLWEDSYPIAINPQALIPGAYHVRAYDDTGHVQLVYQIGLQPDQIPILTLNSTIPRRVRDLTEYVFLDAATHASAGGFMRMRWPQWNADVVSFVADELMPHFSWEQFDPRFVRGGRKHFWEEVFYRLNPGANLEMLSERSLIQVRDLYLARIPVVEEGYTYCRAHSCSEGTLDWNAWSTPSRDKRIASSIGVFESLYQRTGGTERIRRLLSQDILSLGRDEYSLNQLIQIWNRHAYSSDPNVPIRRRWGL